MNISDEQIGQLVQLAIPLAAVVELIKDGTPTAEHLTAAKKSVLQITQMMRTTYPFSLFGFPADGHDIQQIFSDKYIENAIAYINAAQEIGMAAVFDEQYKKGVDFPRKIVCQQGCFSPLLETQSQGATPLWTPHIFSSKMVPKL